MKIIYTESAKSELNLFHQHQQEKLEEIIKRAKYVYGDDSVELTASDIREATKLFFVRNDRRDSLPLTRLLLKTYFVFGLLMVAFGLFYEPLIKLYEENPTRALVIGTGAMLSIFSVIVNYIFRIKHTQNLKHKFFVERSKHD